MKRSRVVLGVAFVSSLFWLAGCGQGTYRIPAVEPVVKPKPGNDLLEDIEGGDSKPASTDSKPSSSPPPAEKAPEAKPEEPKPDATKGGAAEPAKSDASKTDKSDNGKAPKAAAKPADAKPADAKPAHSGKPKEKK